MWWLTLWIISLILVIATGVVGFGFPWSLVGGLLWLAVATFLMVWFWLAPRNYFFTFVKEGTAKIIVKGDAFVKALIQWEGYTFDKEWNVVKKREPWHPFGGLRFYGIWPVFDVFVYWFKWSGVTEDGQVVHHPKKLIDYILMKDDVYWTMVNEAEDKNLLPLDVELVLTLRVLNPYKALFRVQNWLETVINRIKPAVRDVVTNREYENWVTMPEEMGEEIFRLCKKRRLLREFKERYGVDLRKIQVKTINPPATYREKTLAPYLAEMDKRAIEIRAGAEAERINRVFSQIREFGDLGSLLRFLEAVEKSPEQGSKWVIPLPGGAELLQRVFGRPVEDITRQELAELRTMVERVIKNQEKA